MRVLVAYGSRMGGTAGIAEMIGSRLADAGMQVEVGPAPEVSDLADYEADADWFPASAMAKTKGRRLTQSGADRGRDRGPPYPTPAGPLP